MYVCFCVHMCTLNIYHKYDPSFCVFPSTALSQQCDAYVILCCWSKHTCNHREGIKDVSVTLVPLAYDKGDSNISDTKKVSTTKQKVSRLHIFPLNKHCANNFAYSTLFTAKMC